jgi:hypothetical protein
MKPCVDCGVLFEPKRRPARCGPCRRIFDLACDARQGRLSKGATNKQCAGCGVPKPLTAFYRQAAGTFGTSPQCKECRLTYFRATQDDYRKRKSARRKVSSASPAEAARVRRAAANYAAKYPEKAKAKRLIRDAIVRGEIAVPQFCSQCGSSGVRPRHGARAIQGHHDDYTRPLDVRWLCHSCHADVHWKDRGAHAPA